jgi:SAM-dependent methyltransferase
MNSVAHYDKAYFDWQRAIGEFGAKANLFRFAPHIRPEDNVLDFGCGGGYLLAELKCKNKLGIEINKDARTAAGRLGIQTVGSTDEVPDCWASVIVSNSALEHTENPIAELRKLLPKLIPGGKIVCCLPHETLSWAYLPCDINQHLYTWSPMCAGNLFVAAGFNVQEVLATKRVWPPGYRTIHSIVGPSFFVVVCGIYRLLRVALSPLKPLPVDGQVVVIALRPAELGGVCKPHGN